MSNDTQFETLHGALVARFPGTPVEGSNGKPGRLHLYHAPNSICSQKVRAVLAQTAQPYTSHQLNIMVGDSYDPAYVRLRMLGCAAAGLDLVTQHLGSTSVASGGCDACVVPTLVDAEAAKVLVDSRNICLELDRINPGAPAALVPPRLRHPIEADIAIVDELPNYQLLAVGVGKAAASGPKNSFSVSKVARCNTLLAEHSGDSGLCAAYSSKRAKEQMAADRLFDTASMESAHLTMMKTLRELDARLAQTRGEYLYGDILTMTDVFWGLELIRHDDLGLSVLWEDGRLPRVASYFERLCKLPALTKAVIDWPEARLKRRAALDSKIVEALMASDELG